MISFYKLIAWIPGNRISGSIIGYKYHLFYRCFQMTLVNTYRNPYRHQQWIRCPCHQLSQLWTLWTVSNSANWMGKYWHLVNFTFYSPDRCETQYLFIHSGHLYFFCCKSPIYTLCPFSYWDVIFLISNCKHLLHSKLLWLYYKLSSPVIYQL